MADAIINPTTGRKVKAGSSAHIKLAAQGLAPAPFPVMETKKDVPMPGLVLKVIDGKFILLSDGSELMRASVGEKPITFLMNGYSVSVASLPDNSLP